MGGEGFIAVKGKWKGVTGDMVFVNVYAPNMADKRINLWNRLLALINSTEAAWCLCGDFNEVRQHGERFNCQFNKQGADYFNDFIREAQLVDIPMGGRKFTRVGADWRKFSKLVRVLVSGNFLDYWSNLSVTALDRKLSDHCPILLSDKLLDFGPKPFRFFDAWLDKHDIEVVIKNAWAKSVTSFHPDCIFRDKLKNVKNELREWSMSRFGKLEGEIQNFKTEAMNWEVVAESRELNDDERSTWLETRRKWLEKDREKLNMAKQKARVRWDVEGDENSKFFHAMVKRRNGKNNIRGIMINGIWNEEPDDIKAETHRFFKLLFTETRFTRPVFVNELVRSLSLEDSLGFEAAFSESEVWEAICLCGSSKAHGPDGFNFKFIKRFWEYY